MQGYTTEYLVLWKSWPKETCQWVKAENICFKLCRYHAYFIFLVAIYISICYREFIDPHPQEHAIQESIGNFTLAIDRSLRVEC